MKPSRPASLPPPPGRDGPAEDPVNDAVAVGAGYVWIVSVLGSLVSSPSPGTTTAWERNQPSKTVRLARRGAGEEHPRAFASDSRMFPLGSGLWPRAGSTLPTGGFDFPVDFPLLPRRARVVAGKPGGGPVQLFVAPSEVLAGLFDDLATRVQRPAGPLPHLVTEPALRLLDGGDALLSGIQTALPEVGEPVPFIGHAVPLARELVAFVGDTVAFVSVHSAPFCLARRQSPTGAWRVTAAAAPPSRLGRGGAGFASECVPGNTRRTFPEASAG
jgi:hypothetical protein